MTWKGVRRAWPDRQHRFCVCPVDGGKTTPQGCSAATEQAETPAPPEQAETCRSRLHQGAEKPERKQNPFRLSLGDRRVGCDRGAGTGLSGVSLTRHGQTPNTAVRCRGPEPGATTRLRCRSGLRTIFRDLPVNQPSAWSMRERTARSSSGRSLSTVAARMACEVSKYR